jgi:glucosamine-6-phosphate deaminase
METIICADAEALARAAAECGAAAIREAIARRGQATVVLATGTSQLATLHHLAGAPDIAWHRVQGYHLDEYIGLPISHPASFRRYLWQRFISRLPFPLAAFHYINGEGDPHAECDRLSAAIVRDEVDVAFIGIGENGHLAFNDPPADFQTSEPYIVVELDTACRRQQLGEGWFERLADVPRQAISMSIRQIMASRALVCAVPDLRKAEAVSRCLDGPVTEHAPASILQRHPDCTVFLDPASASLLARKPRP